MQGTQRGGLVFKAHRLVNHSTLGSRVIKRRYPAVEDEVVRTRGVDHLVRPPCPFQCVYLTHYIN